MYRKSGNCTEKESNLQEKVSIIQKKNKSTKMKCLSDPNRLPNTGMFLILALYVFALQIVNCIVD